MQGVLPALGASLPSKPQPRHAKYLVPPWDNGHGLGTASWQLSPEAGDTPPSWGLGQGKAPESRTAWNCQLHAGCSCPVVPLLWKKHGEKQENHEGSLCVSRPRSAAAGPVLRALTREELMWLPAKGTACFYLTVTSKTHQSFLKRLCQAARAVIPPRVRPGTGLHLADSGPACFTNLSIPAGSGTGEGSQHGRG